MAKSFPKIIGSMWKKEETMRTAAILMSLMLSGFLFLEPSFAASSSEALRKNLAALQKTSPGSSQERALLEKILRLARKVNPKPAVPEEAHRRLARYRRRKRTLTGSSSSLSKNPCRNASATLWPP